MVTQNQIIKQIDNVLDFLSPNLFKLANCHMVDFFTKSVYANCTSKDIQIEINTLGSEKAFDVLLKNDLNLAPSLQKYVESCSNLTLKNSQLCMKSEQFFDKLSSLGVPENKRIKMEVFMNLKKSHEVEILSDVVASMTELLELSHLIDIGDGKGYLSSLLALQYRIPVLGIDACNINTCGALKRADKLSRVWKNVEKAPRKSLPKKDTVTQSINIDLYRQLTEFVDQDTDLCKLIKENYQDSDMTNLKLGLIGLHTCGDLAANSLRIFTENSAVKLIANVGCCYHLINEELDQQIDSLTSSFPLSQYLKNKRVSIGRQARMMANQSVDRIVANQELPNKTIFYRALLQIILTENCKELPTKHVGRFKKGCKSFTDYATQALRRLEVDFKVADDELEKLERKYENRIGELNVFYLIRSKVAPVIEALILLDRLLFLVESGFEMAYLVQLFNPVISPRCYGIVAFKTNVF